MPILTKHTLTFLKKDVQVLLEHSRRCQEHAPTYVQLYEPALRLDGLEVPEGVLPTADDIDMAKVPVGLHLVGDDGIYLLSNGLPGDILPDKRHRVVYADGLNPYEEEFDTWWETKRRIMGGDDQVIFIPAEDIVRGLARAGERLVVEIINNRMSVTHFEVL